MMSVDAVAPMATTPGTSVMTATITSVRAPAIEPTEMKRVAITATRKTAAAIPIASGASNANAPARAVLMEAIAKGLAALAGGK